MSSVTFQFVFASMSEMFLLDCLCLFFAIPCLNTFSEIHNALLSLAIK